MVEDFNMLKKDILFLQIANEFSINMSIKIVNNFTECLCLLFENGLEKIENIQIYFNCLLSGWKFIGNILSKIKINVSGY